MDAMTTAAAVSYPEHEMYILTKRQVIQSVAGRFHNAYQNRLDIPLSSGQTPADTLTKLEALDPNTATEDDVEAVIGNRSWTTLECNECEKLCEEIAFLETSDHFFQICRHCVENVLEAMVEARS